MGSEGPSRASSIKLLSEDTIQQYQDPGISIRQPSTKTPLVPIEPVSIDYFGQNRPIDPISIDDFGQKRHLKSNSSSLLDPFGDSWRKVKLSRNITIYLYSAFYDDRVAPSIRINVAAPTKLKVIKVHCLK